MKRFLNARNGGHHSWPEPTKEEGSHLFAARPQFRKLVVMIDDELLVATRSKPIKKNELVADLLDSQLIDMYRYRDDGPPMSLPPSTEAPLRGASPAHRGWVVVTDADPDHEIWGATYESGSGSWTQAGIAGNAVAIAADDDQTNAYSDLESSVASDRRRADGLAVQVASQALGADIYVTLREYPHAAAWISRGVTICRPDEALPLIGLYLRAQGAFQIASKYNFNRGLYYWVGTRELLPASWRWFAACVQHDEPSPERELSDLGQSLLQRAERALEARDRVLVALNQPQHNDTRREVLASLDDILVDLMGTVDAAARVAHRVLGLPPGSEYTAAWQRVSWLGLVAQAAPTLAQVTTLGTPASDALTILRRLRNSVHGTALRAMALKEVGARDEQTIVEIPPNDTEVLDAMDKLGGRAAWGARQLLPNRVHIDVAVFIDALLPRILALLNELMERTPVEQLANVALGPSDCVPPAPDPHNTGIWDEWVRTSIRWQLGL